ncbi:hypothetical protein M1247_34255 [Mycobacterium sp. 21AC1]|uniref:hypothetical protein n=1 Tax=[Mycobacterium] appelbergii TaxID=2939269 RepID=UPI0029390C01|nr:hypothetical protein [Mycobacterium sp. 21AC1]MDV3130009.1 hypothetical protein [Mycobacterium sp. 21AC1]
MTPGDQLRADMARAIQHAAAEAGRPLEYDEREARTIEHAAAAADRAEQLRALWAAELAADTRASVAVKIAAEIRLCEKHVTDLLARVNPGPGQAKSEQHQRAARARWDRDPLRRRRGPA